MNTYTERQLRKALRKLQEATRQVEAILTRHEDEPHMTRVRLEEASTLSQEVSETLRRERSHLR